MYPVDAKSGTSNEQAARTDVIPAAVPSIVFSGKKVGHVTLSHHAI